MSETDAVRGFIPDSLDWTAQCQIQAGLGIEPDAQDAFKHLPEEFQSGASEIGGAD